MQCKERSIDTFVTGTEKINCETTQIAIKELKRRINNDDSLNEYGIEVFKEAIAFLEGRERVTKLQFQVSS